MPEPAKADRIVLGQGPRATLREVTRDGVMLSHDDGELDAHQVRVLASRLMRVASDAEHDLRVAKHRANQVRETAEKTIGEMFAALEACDESELRALHQAVQFVSAHHDGTSRRVSQACEGFAGLLRLMIAVKLADREQHASAGVQARE